MYLIMYYDDVFYCRECSITFYNENKLLPIYGKPSKGFNKEKILHILLDPNFNSSFLSTDHPVHVEHNVAFVIDLSKLKNKDDVGADDMGTWKCTGSRLLKFSVKVDKKVYQIMNAGAPNSTMVYIRRLYHVHGTDNDFHRMTAYVDSKNSSVTSSRCVVQYWFASGVEHSINIKAHGNSKIKTESYCRTHPSTLSAIKDYGKDHAPKETITAIYTAEGGIIEANSVGKLPRNRQQVSNYRRGATVPLCSKKSQKDPLFMVMEQSKLCGETFVRIVTATPEPMCIMATDNQLRDLERFSTNPNSFCVVSIDPTFSLGDFSVTCLAYRHLLVIDRRTEQSPIMLGPILVHQRKTFQTYNFFCSSLIGLLPSLDKMLAFGTDGEEALAMAFEKQFKFAIHLRCFRHLKQNIHRKLTIDMGATEQQTSEILSHIFGMKSGPKFFEGLVDAPDESSFDKKLEHLKSTWEEMFVADKQGLSFYSWFIKYHAKVIKTNMLKPVRQSAGFGDPPAEFCTNDSEAINSTLKQFLNFQKLDWPVFNEKIKEFVLEQQSEVEKSVVGIGQYIIREEYLQFRVSQSKWFTSLSADQRKTALKKFHCASVDDKCSPANAIESSVPSTSAILPTTSHSSATSIHQQLSVSIDSAAEITRLPTLFLRQVWSKASELLAEQKVTTAPSSSPKFRMVASKSNKKPHFVSTKNNTDLFECDNECEGFCQRYICAYYLSC
jgi:hypothetical protein